MTRRVLVVEDEPMIGLLWRHVGALVDVEVTVVASVTQARAALAHDPPPDGVICDWRLGRTETAEALVDELLGRSAPPLLVTGDPRVPPAVRERCAVLDKPLDLDRIEAALLGEAIPLRRSEPPRGAAHSRRS